MIERWRCTFTVLPATAIRALLDYPNLSRDAVATLTKLYSGGAPIPMTLADEWRTATGQPLYSIYGLTETTSPTHAAPLGQPVRTDPASGLLSVGVTVPGAEARVAGPDGEEVSEGELGEIWLKGPMVVPGYWQRPEATAEAFVDGYLRSGDVGLRDANGWFYVVDRIKDMINASGYKVWPREVEETLLGHPAIAEAAVVGVPDPYRGETVKAFVRLRAGASATPEDIGAWARDHMAAYKYPRQVEIVAELPKTASGKVLRRTLRSADAAR
jgi:long-chain acyl-CoA synthetase